MNRQPDKIGRYPVVRLIGQGAMGAVYLARDTELDRDVAIKTVRNAGNTPDEQESFFTRFRNEARAVGRLKHPSIVAVYDVGTDPTAGPYLVFEYVEGPTLKRLLAAKGPLDPKALVALAEQIGEALEIAHSEGIIHRDIKPENLLVGRDGRTHLADFGVARVPDAALTSEGQFLGTPCYAAPETLRSGTYGPRSDQFSFAAVLYEGAAGTRAFPGEEAMAVAQRVIHDDPVLPSLAAVAGARVPPGLDAVIMRGLSKQPADRFDSIVELVAAVREAYADTGAISASSDPVPKSTPRVDRRLSGGFVAHGPIKLWPFVALFALGVVALVQLNPGTPMDVLPDPSSAPSPVTSPEQSATVPNAPGPVGKSAERLGETTDKPVPNENPAIPTDSGLPPAPPEPLSAFEREERAKDALERAQRALDAGDKEGARSALDEAYQYDPEQPDIQALRNRL